MGAFLVLSADYRVGAAGPYRLAANEVAIGITVPYAAVEILHHRLSPAYFTRAAILAEPFPPETAVQAGFLDEVVAPSAVRDTAHAVAQSLAKLHTKAHAATKLRARHHTLQAIRTAMTAEFGSSSA